MYTGARLRNVYVRGVCALCGWTGLGRAFRPNRPTVCQRCGKQAVRSVNDPLMRAPAPGAVSDPDRYSMT